MQLTIVIVSYNVKYFLEQCLYSVLQATKGISAEVLVVDNFSMDESVAYLKKQFPSVTFLELKENIGFARANNKVLELLNGRFVLLLNPDTIITQESVLNCIRHFEKNPSTGALGVRMINGCGSYLRESKRGSMQLWTSLTKILGLASLFPKSRIFSSYYIGWLPEDENHPVAVLSGAFLMIRKDLYQSIGGFDERFFMYGEDIELSYAVMDKGFANHYLGETTILHFKGESTIKDRNYRHHFFEAMNLFNEKRASWLVKILTKPMIRAIKWMMIQIDANLKKNQPILIKPNLDKPPTEAGIIEVKDASIPTVLHVAGGCYTYEKIIKYIEQHPKKNHYIHHLSSKSMVSSGQSVPIN
jgi:GT2 family glycosyltransferase